MRRRRNSLRLGSHDYASSGAYFVTVCARDRVCLFGEVVDDRIRLTAAGRAVADAWGAIPHHHPSVAVDCAVVMPNHHHGILVLEDVGAGYIPPLPTVVATFKAAASRAVGRSLWQRGYHDRVIRNERELEALRRYIAENPLRWAVDRENPAVDRQRV